VLSWDCSLMPTRIGRARKATGGRVQRLLGGYIRKVPESVGKPPIVLFSSLALLLKGLMPATYNLIEESR